MSEKLTIPSFSDRVKMKAIIKDFANNMDMEINLIQIQAKLTRAKYHALVKEGFSVNQAIELCKEERK